MVSLIWYPLRLRSGLVKCGEKHESAPKSSAAWKLDAPKYPCCGRSTFVHRQKKKIVYARAQTARSIALPCIPRFSLFYSCNKTGSSYGVMYRRLERTFRAYGNNLLQNIVELNRI